MSFINQARLFRQVFNHPLPENFSGSADEYEKKIKFQFNLIAEECEEMQAAAWEYMTMLHWYQENRVSEYELKGSRCNLLKEMADSVFVIYQLAAFLGLNLDEAMNRISQSNMTKLDGSGNPIYDEAGKVMKGPNYIPPNLFDLA